jgi:starch synthase (maltosyl-transferring)
LRHWDLKKPGNLTELVARVNRIRREHPALQSNESLEFHKTDNEQIIAYSKAAGDDIVVVIVNLDPLHLHRGHIELPLEGWGIGPTDNYQFHDLLTDARFLWSGPKNFVQLDPKFVPAHILALKRYVRTERDFDYFI